MVPNRDPTCKLSCMSCDVGMTAVEGVRACCTASEGGRFVRHLRCDRRGLEGETRRDEMR